MTKSLTVKIFFITFISFIVLIIGIVAFIAIYFSVFYENEKINKIISNMNEFAVNYEKNAWTNEVLNQEANRFMINNSATMSIFTYTEIALDGLEDVYIDINNQLGLYTITVDEGEKSYVELSLQEEDYDVIFGDKVVKKGDDVSIVGYLNEFNIVTPYSINDILVNKQVDVETLNYERTVRIVDVQNVPVEEETSKLLFNATAGLSGVSEWYLDDEYYKQEEKNSITYIISTIPYSNFKQVDFSKTIKTEDGDTTELYVNVSLQSIDEVMNIFKKYYPVFFVLTIMVSVVVSLFYSSFVSNPVVEITAVANRMARMDFKAKLKVNRYDEIGDLSISLNTLSGNLETALNDLIIANEKLKLDYDKEVKQEKTRQEFIANISHELKSPLGVIKSFAEGIKDGVKEEKKEYYTEVILDEIDKMDNLIQEMLKLSKLDAGITVYRKKESDVREIIDNIVSYNKIALLERNITVKISGDYGRPIIDREKIGQVLLNLIGNAIKYCEVDSVIRIQGAIVSKGVIIYIENDCAPFSHEDLDKIWTRFYKIDRSHNREQEGTGLGLAITKSILEGHKSEFGVMNIENGVRFYILLK